MEAFTVEHDLLGPKVEWALPRRSHGAGLCHADFDTWGGQMEDAGAHNKNITATKERYRSWGSNGSCLLVPATGKTTVARGTQKLETTLGL
ncbi:hypothetical protein F2Q68_00042685 [Brassica cretica]|uniref:Uncharacterized protein n=1 Tax=Brassica cretica TaxID=69181 RepID=A0A8S9MU19_BRACR|nr:hypothetical protein F2Q68_00042685 [Brassica cretica]